MCGRPAHEWFEVASVHLGAREREPTQVVRLDGHARQPLPSAEEPVCRAWVVVVLAEQFAADDSAVWIRALREQAANRQQYMGVHIAADQPTRVGHAPVVRVEQYAGGLERVRRDDDEPTPLNSPRPMGVHVFNSVGTIAIHRYPQYVGTSAELGAETPRLGYQRDERMA